MKRYLIKRNDSDAPIEITADRFEIIDGVYNFFANESIIYTTPLDLVSECVMDSVNTSEYTLLKS